MRTDAPPARRTSSPADVATRPERERLRLVEPGSPPPEPARSVEVAALVRVQHAVGRPPVVRAARGLSLFGEHALGWFAVGVVGAHAASIAVKRVVRRQRPIHESVQVLVDTPSSLSFPSSHATSTTAAAVVYSGLTGRNLVPLLVPPMLLSRLVLGVHYPTDVLAGSALGAAVGGLVRRALRGRRRPR